MSIYPIGGASSFDDMPKGTMFYGEVGDKIVLLFRCAKVISQSTEDIEYAAVFDRQVIPHIGNPIVIEGASYFTNKLFEVRGSYVKPDLSSMDLSYNNPKLGDIVYFESAAYFVLASERHGRMYVNIDTGYALENVNHDLPRAIFRRWSIVQRVFDREEVLFTYEPAPAR
ncbi:hypothetical protein [Azospirillum brasilense]|uniref:hypothetical protein n=1 Tax=Azospirillum brasilense TaxID=192 RepID=UPI000FED0180|nr:hypothetical protein [Azospirillum brasilense]NUB25724.1 hypothetical protein [Azospirillum brasilense]NUB33862.1 hypothetical protein [Azospirillum brasilense]RIW07763.1 hypothetical protein D2T81_02685 [Azospirillum brasilense]